MKTKLAPLSPRIEVVDALRGFAVMAIILLHNIEHFNFYSFPPQPSAWLKTTDAVIWDTLFFLFSGKAYAIFALLFGFTFFLQSDSRRKKGEDFKNRYIWRLFLLFLIGNVNAIFFPGEILVLYSIIGLALIPVRNLPTRTVFVVAFLLMLQPVEWGKAICAWCDPAYRPAKNLFSLGDVYPQLGGSSFVEMMKANLYKGQLASLNWAWNYGRFCQTASLFMLGMLLGRKKLFQDNPATSQFWKYVLAGSTIAFVSFYLTKNALPGWVGNKSVLRPLSIIVSSWSNVAFMGVLVAGFVLLYRRGAKAVLGWMATYGKMSLTNYVMQSVIGSMLYFGYGLALHKTCGITYSFLIGILFLLLQVGFCHVWLKYHAKGPLETLWHAGTWINKKKR